ncbi:MAG: MEKHLA domain-containing protein [Nitrospira sp.]|nr:MEKHLA domain-containing protein [Nitrospira sp.]MDH4251011.1 MEKHLA domain-containing protein [Nitrospira sp.]MDH4343323.1 MEKHLA domain-containing protein [Nitrospira sp.]MDH5336321.1 MEKHLA domain-containing protein [Nitrospira sp.]
MESRPWSESRIVEWSHRLLESYHYWIGQDLIDRAGDRKAQALRLFEVSVVVVSHGVEPDPILNYGNQTALDLWELPWKQFIQTPSRLTAEADDRTERRRMLERAKLAGYFDGYRGVRISSTGRRFLVEQAVIWNVIDPAGHRIGQAATFSQWSYL